METVEQRRKFLIKIRDTLLLLRTDAELIAGGVDVYYIVDFAAIYGYIYKTPDPPFLPIPGESEEQTFARRQVALEILFTRFHQPLLLIPPYVAELQNHLRSLALELAVATLDSTRILREKLERLIKGSKEFKIFIELQAGGEVTRSDSALRKAAVAVGKEHFPEVYAALACNSLEASSALRALFKKGALLDSVERLPNLRDVDYSNANTRDWFNKISHFRNAPQRSMQTRIDAMACKYVEVANQRLNSDGKIVLFMSPSTSVEKALKDSLVASLPSQFRLEVVRDLTYCLFSALHRREDGYDRTLITDHLSVVGNLLSILDSPIPENRREDAVEATREWKRCENLLMINELATSTNDSAISGKNLDSEFMGILTQLHQAVTKEGEGLRKEIETTFKRLRDDIIQLSKLTPGSGGVHSYSPIRRWSSRSETTVVLPWLHDELEISIKFTDRNAVELARKFKSLRDERYSYESLMALRNYVVHTATDAATADYRLLSGYMLALEEKFEAALSELTQALRTADSSAQLETVLLMGAILKKRGDAERAVECLERAVSLDSRDPRANVEYARALWLLWRKGLADARRCDALDEALVHLQSAAQNLRKGHQKRLSVQIENVSAYIYTERALASNCGREDDLSRAAGHIHHMEVSCPEAEWLGRFFDTRAYWRYARARVSGVGRKEQKRLLEAALSDVQRALGKEDVADRGFGIRYEHQAMISDALKLLATFEKEKENTAERP